MPAQWFEVGRFFTGVNPQDAASAHLFAFWRFSSPPNR